jgi:DNA processing protein
VTDQEIFDLFKLYSVPGIGPGRFRLLVAKFGTVEKVLNAPIQELIRIPGIDKTTARRIKQEYDEKFAEFQLQMLKRTAGRMVTYMHPEYPPLLQKIYDPPVFLFMNGHFTPADQLALAVVGTRDPTFYGQQITRTLCRDLCAHGITIVSGLARGIDTIAHQTALQAGGRTVAVLGSGLDTLYPPENKNLARKISQNGAVISEFPFGTQPDAGNFPRRNRIISGLSRGVLVIEAGLKSGALITAFEALEQNRDVFAVPGSVTSPNSAGTNRLIREGAALVRSIEDIIEEIDPSLGANLVPVKVHLPELKDHEKEIFRYIQNAPRHIDQIARSANKSPAETLAILLTLELMGYVKQLAGKMFVRM